MGLNLSQSVQLEFWSKSFGADHKVTQAVNKLISAGWQITVAGLYTLQATGPTGWMQKLALSIGYSTLMKGVSNPAAQASRAQIATWVSSLCEEAFGQPLPEDGPVELKPQVLMVPPPKLPDDVMVYHLTLNSKGPNVINTIKALRELMGCSLKEAKMIVDGAPCVFAMNVTQKFIKKAEGLLNPAGVSWLSTQANNPDAIHGVKNLMPPALVGVIGIDDLDWNFDTNELKVLLHGGYVISISGEAVKDAIPVATAKPVPQPLTGAPVRLKDAQTLLQKVKGTDSGSVYYVIGLNPRVKVACRVRNKGHKTLSFRVETLQPTPMEMARIKGCGLQWHGDYGSIHMEAGDVPAGRVIGAFLMGLRVRLEQAVMFEEDIPVEA